MEGVEGWRVAEGGLPASVHLLPHPPRHEKNDVPGGGGTGSVSGIGDGYEATVAQTWASLLILLLRSSCVGPPGEFESPHFSNHLRFHSGGGGGSLVSLGLGDLLPELESTV